MSVLVAVAAVIAGLVGNAVMNPPYLAVFLEYFAFALLVVSVMLGRIIILQACLFIVRGILKYFIGRMTFISRMLRDKIDEINSQQVVFFTRGDNLANLNKAILYVQQNEHTNRLKVVTVIPEKGEIAPNLRRDLDMLDETYPGIDIELVVQVGKFGPEMIETLSKQWNIPTNLMFIGSPGTHFLYGLAELGGVRLII
jgi:hypothetical protein